MFINTSTKEFAIVNNAIPSHGIAIEHFLYYKMLPMITKNFIIFLKNKTFLFTLVQSYRSNREGDVGL